MVYKCAIIENMERYKATIVYDGTDFAGFQLQPNGIRTVQKELEIVLTQLNSFNPVVVHGAGRTDSGVHALGQVIHFDLLKRREIEKLRFALDTQLPTDIAVLSVEKVSNDFHAQYHPHEKIYVYLLDNAPIRSPFKRYSEAWFRYPLDVEKIRKALFLLLGTHDFTGFTASGSSVDDKIRTITKADLSIEKTTLCFTFQGNGFLYKQIRNMVGTLIKIGNGKFPVNRIDEILETRNRQLAGPTAHPEGLYLKEVIYK